MRTINEILMKWMDVGENQYVLTMQERNEKVHEVVVVGVTPKSIIFIHWAYAICSPISPSQLVPSLTCVVRTLWSRFLVRKV